MDRVGHARHDTTYDAVKILLDSVKFVVGCLSMTSSQLRSLRRKTGLTQAEFGSRIQMDGSTISRLENGNRTIPHYFKLLLIEARLLTKRKAGKRA